MAKVAFLLLTLCVLQVAVCFNHAANKYKVMNERSLRSSSVYDSIPILQFNQKVDHFDYLNQDTYTQRYSVNASSDWKEGDPIFIFLSGEAAMEFFEFQEVQAREWAAEFGAMYISLEHRFYGDSIPYNSTHAYATENLRLLSSQQALADAAYFIENFEQQALPELRSQGIITSEIKTGATSKWIVFGCSYSGGLSAWFRSKYSHLVVASIAPSGPVHAIANYSSYNAWFQQVASPECVASVQSAINLISTLLLTDAGRAQLETAFAACKPIKDPYYFLYQLVSGLASTDQFENPPQWPLNQTCQIMTSNDSYLQNWATVLATQQGPKASECNDFDEESDLIEPLRDLNDQDRSWWWQMCTEFGYFTPTYGSIFWPEYVTLDRQVKWCEKIFGVPGLQPNTDWTNAYYGGYNLHGSNIMFSNGLFDPWHLLSINEDNGYGVQAVTYSAGHCATMTASYPDDPQSLIEARAVMGKFLAQNLSQ